MISVMKGAWTEGGRAWQKPSRLAERPILDQGMDLHRYPNYGYLRLQSNMAIIHGESAYNVALLETGSKISVLESGRTLALLESRCNPSLTHNGSETHRKNSND